MLNYFNPNNTLVIINRLRKFVFALFIIVLLIGLFEALILMRYTISIERLYTHQVYGIQRDQVRPEARRALYTGPKPDDGRI